MGLTPHLCQPVVRRVVQVKHRNGIYNNFLRKTWGVARSVYDNFIVCAPLLIPANSNFATMVFHPNTGLSHVGIKHSKLQLFPPPWCIPPETQLSTMKTICPTRSPPDHRMEHYFSAIATAIKFLQSVSTSTQSYLRTFVLNEDQKSVGCQ